MEKKEYWITNSRFKIILLVFFIFWLGIMALFYLKTDEVTKNPCQICAKQQGTQVLCTMLGGNGNQQTFYPNFSIIFMADINKSFKKEFGELIEKYPMFKKVDSFSKTEKYIKGSE